MKNLSRSGFGYFFRRRNAGNMQRESYMKKLLKMMSNICMIFLFLFLAGSSLWACVLPEKQTVRVGLTTRSYHDADRDRNIKTYIWYPIQPVEKRVASGSFLAPFQLDKRLINDALPMAGTKPLVLFSHGTEGSVTNYSWFIRNLVENGFIVAGIDHPGNTWYDKTPDGYIAVWERPQDVSFVLNRLLKDSAIGPLIDAGRIAAAGHSAGGYTALALAGAKYNMIQMIEFCSETENDPVCLFPDDINWSKMIKRFSSARLSYADERIQAVFAMAPAVAQGVDANSLKAITVPVFLVGAIKDNVTPYKTNVAYYSAHVHGVKLLKLDADEGHFIFLDLCTSFGRNIVGALCLDHPGVDRQAVHERLNAVAIEFFRDALGIPNEKN
jgi:predicted dienelactone hydrolase